MPSSESDRDVRGRTGSTRHAHPAASASTRPGSRSALLWRSLFVLTVLLHLYGLYWPSQPSPSLGVPQADKIGHVLMFGAVAFTAVRAFGRARLVVAVLAVHALVSEGVQHVVLPDRAGDLFDVAADLIGTVVFAWLAWCLPRRRPSTP